MGRSTFLLVTALLLTLAAQSQSKVSVRGKLADSTHKTALAGVRINLVATNDSLAIYKAVSDSSGSFEIPGVQKGNFLLTLTVAGYRSSVTSLSITDTSANTGTIFLAREVNTDSHAVVAKSATTDTAVKPGSFSITNISGILQDKTDKTPIKGATVNIRFKKNPGVKQNAVSDGKGYFSFTELPADTFILSFSSIGYEFVDRQINPSAVNNDLGIIYIPKTSKELEGVVITAKTPPAQQKGDTVQV